MSVITDKLKKLKEDVANTCSRCGRNEKSVQIVVVTKTATLPAIKDVIRQGFYDLGENRVQHLKQVSEEIAAFLKENHEDKTLPSRVNWHMIGHLQRNKAKQTLQLCEMVHSVDTLRLAEELLPEVVVLDVMIPHMDGWEVLQRLRAKPETRHINIVICSIFNDPELAFSLGAADVLTKPLSQSALLDSLQNLGLS